MTDKVIEMLNNDPKARKLLGEYKRAAKKHNATEAEYEAGLEIITMVAVIGNEEALSLMAEETYKLLNS